MGLGNGTEIVTGTDASDDTLTAVGEKSSRFTPASTFQAVPGVRPMVICTLVPTIATAVITAKPDETEVLPVTAPGV